MLIFRSGKWHQSRLCGQALGQGEVEKKLQKPCPGEPDEWPAIFGRVLNADILVLVYYYFKTRDELIRAVIELRAEAVCELLESLEREPSPDLRLKGLARSWSEASSMVAAYGCPIGSLCSELNKADSGLKIDAAALLSSLVDWIENQFEALGQSAARDPAISLMARVQGAALLADTFEDPALMEAEVRGIENWIDSLAA